MTSVRTVALGTANGTVKATVATVVPYAAVALIVAAAALVTPTAFTVKVSPLAGAAVNWAVSRKLALALFALLTTTSTGVLSVKLAAATVLVTPAGTTPPNAETGPNARVAALVPAPPMAAPAASFWNTKLMDEFTVAVTVKVPADVFPACPKATDDMSIISAIVMVRNTSFFIWGSLIPWLFCFLFEN